MLIGFVSSKATTIISQVILPSGKGKMVSDVVIISKNPESDLSVRLCEYISQHLPGVKAERRSYNHAGGAGNDNLVFAECYTPAHDYYSVLYKLKKEGNLVFMLSEREDVSIVPQQLGELGIEGVIFVSGKSVRNGFEGFLRFGGIKPAAELLMKYAEYVESY